MTTIGELKNIPSETNVVQRGQEIEWKIFNFSSLSCENDSSYHSPSFHFADETWQLKIYPNGLKIQQSVGCISLYLSLVNKSSGPPVNLNFTLGLKSANGEKDSEHHRRYIFNNADTGYGVHSCLLRVELYERAFDLLLSDVLTVFCHLKYPKTAEFANVGCLGQDFKKVLLNGTGHDIILKTGRTKLRAHRDILKARSRVFESMLTHDMKEKQSGVIDVPDCDPEAMKQFLLYVYSGNVEKLDKNSVIQLYYIADKYEAKDLKEICREFIKQSLSPSNLCKVIQLAVRHSDSKLEDFATQYLSNNMADILRSLEWQSFMKDNFTIANEFLIKSCERKK